MPVRFFPHSDSWVEISLMTKHPLDSNKPSCDKPVPKDCQNGPFYCVALKERHHVSGTLQFPPHLHLPAAQPFFPLPPADVIWIPGLESHPGNRPPPQPASLALHTQRQPVTAFIVTCLQSLCMKHARTPTGFFSLRTSLGESQFLSSGSSAGGEE